MRIEASHLKALPLALLSALCLLAGCPGELPNKAEFEAYEAAHGDAGAPATMNAAGTTSGSAGSTSSAPNGTCGDVVTRILLPSCGGTGCHSALAPQQGLDLVSRGVAARVVGTPGKQCLQLLADPQNPEQSLMYQKLLPKPTCGAQMPLARPALSSADVACVLAWIAAQ